MPDAAQVCAARNDPKIDTQIAAIEPLAMLDGHTLNVQSALILQSTREVVTVSIDRTVRRWRVDERGLDNLHDTASGTDEYRPLPLGHKPPPLTFFDHDRKLLVSPFDSEQSSTWDLSAKRKVASFEAGRVALGPKGEGLKIFRSPADADLIDPATGQLDPNKKARQPPNLYDDTWVVSPDGSRAVGVPGWLDYFAKRNVAETNVSDPPKLRRLFDTSTGESLAELAVADKGVYTPHISQDGSKVFGLAVPPDMHSSDSATGSIAMWDALTGKLLAQTSELKDIDTRILASDSGSFIVALQRVASAPHWLYRPLFFVLENGKLRKFGLNLPSELANGEGAVSAAVLSHDGLVFAAATAQGALYAWNVNNGKLIGSSQTGSAFMDNIALSDAADMMAASDIAGRIYLFSITESQGSDLPIGIVSTGKRVRSLAFSTNGQLLAALLPDDSLRLISIDPLQLQTADKFSMLDWVAAHHFGGVNPEDETKYGLVALQAAERNDYALLAEKPPPRAQPGVRPSLALCDKLASDPYDRNSRAAAVETTKMIQKDAEAACETALADDPEDATTLYQAGRVSLRGARLADAVKRLRRAADKNYPVAMSRLAYLIYMLPELRRSSLGDPNDLMQRAAEAGDLLGTLWISVDKIRNNDAAAISRTMRSATATWRMDAVAGAMLAALGTEKFLQREPDSNELALFFYQLGAILGMSSNDPRMPQHLANTYESIRTIGQNIPPDKMVAIYRKARDWRMVASE